ncbi:MAG: 4Fe-4S dicluster domain-containing protein, partial [Desulfobacterales bacterium]
MNQRRLIIDVGKCQNCNNCFLACKDEHCGNSWAGYAAAQPLHGQRWMNLLSRERGRFPHVDVAYLPKPCQHCGDAPCIAAAEDGAVYRRPDGIVIIDPEKARGQRQLVPACPYGAVWWNPEQQLAQKCTLCAHLLDEGWAVPRCVQACPTGALKLVDWSAEEVRRHIAAEKLEVLERDSAPATWGVYYKNLYRFKH